MTSNRAKLLKLLDEYSRLYPHWRFGQLIANLAAFADVSIDAVSDEQLLDAAEAHLARRLGALQLERAELRQTPLAEVRTELLDAVAALAEERPDWPIGGLTAELARWAGANVYDAEDEQLLSVARDRVQPSPALKSTG